jgi:hypothetical protein
MCWGWPWSVLGRVLLLYCIVLYCIVLYYVLSIHNTVQTVVVVFLPVVMWLTNKGSTRILQKTFCRILVVIGQATMLGMVRHCWHQHNSNAGPAAPQVVQHSKIVSACLQRFSTPIG